MQDLKNEKGFTLIELLLVVIVMGLMLAVIVPRGQRATVEAKYSLVRQTCTELGSFGSNWIEQMMLAQDDNCNASRKDYLDTLVCRSATVGTETSAWIAFQTQSNWNNAGGTGNYIPIIGRRVGGGTTDIPPEVSVEEIIDPAKTPRNPFNGTNIFNANNYSATNVIPGAIACGTASDSSTGASFNYYAFVFMGTDSTTSNADPGAADMHAGMGTDAANMTLTELRNGVFFAKTN